MTLDEAIEHARDKAKEIRKSEKKYREFSKEDDDIWNEEIANCKKCAEEHEQLADWLEELKELRKQKNKFDENIKFFNEINLKCHNQGYNKAIDDFIKKLEEYEHKNWIDNLEYGITWSDIEQIAKELKECEE